MGSEYMIKSAAEIEKELDSSTKEFPDRLRYLHHRNTIQSDATLTTATTVENDIVPETSMGQQTNLQPLISPLDRTQPVIVSSSTSESDLDVEESSTEELHEETEDTPTVPEERKSMEIVFGKDMSTGAPLIWKPNDTNQVFHTNMGIIGTMGTGKTQFTKSLIAQLYRDQEHNFDGSPLGILIFDYKGDYNESKEDFIEATKANLFTLSTFYNANKRILRVENITKKEETFLAKYWRFVSQNIVPWRELSKREISKVDLRENYIVTQAVTIQVLGRLGNFFLSNPSYKMEDILPQLQEVNWRRDNEDWKMRTIRSNGRMIVNEEAIILTCNVLKKHLGLPLDNFEQTKEQTFQIGSTTHV